MQRGVINLSLAEIAAGVDALANTQSIGVFLHEKFQAAAKQKQDTMVQMSEDEVEFLIDQLPPPIPSTPPAATSLRTKLDEFLRKLRGL